MRPGSWAVATERACCHGTSALLSPWTGRDSKGEGCGKRKQQVEMNAWQALVV